MVLFSAIMFSLFFFAALRRLHFLNHRAKNTRMIRVVTVTIAATMARIFALECFEGWRPGGGNSQMTGSSLLSSGDAGAILFDSIKTLLWSN